MSSYALIPSKKNVKTTRNKYLNIEVFLGLMQGVKILF